MSKTSAIYFFFAHTLWKIAWNFPCYFTVLGRHLGPGTTCTPGNCLKVATRNKANLSSGKRCCGGEWLTDNWAQELFLLPAGLDWSGDWVARNGSVLIYSGDDWWMPNLEVECRILGLGWGNYVWFRIYSQIGQPASPPPSFFSQVGNCFGNSLQHSPRRVICPSPWSRQCFIRASVVEWVSRREWGHGRVISAQGAFGDW